MPQNAGHARFLREQAERLRDIATTHKTELSATLLKMARELEARADQIENDRAKKPG